MLTKPISIVLLISLLSANLSNVLVFAGFKMNQAYIAKTLCENRDKPVVMCGGTCYLKKKLKQAEENEQKQERQASQKVQVQEALISDKTFQFKRFSLASIAFHVPLCTGSPSSTLTYIFHPPKV